ncbi:hypothetical protein TCAL_05514 [Tigriopus californicus]|uniref:CDK-activating kinase assembly factor MAT1 n=1 Tax=Tigriopus californicus TaxID=6832 RepID=A0A553NQ35_TIGCA|nr:CDK-activating kinase assembly factor MAT1-like [Tigriopus californicus]TRY67553.1 hypothetical protein TCAL_05514 [Tigriopus californicus]
MEEQACPKCKTTLYRNPNMKLMVNVCGHNLCDSCVELLFAKGSGACPECGIALRRANFRHQLFEDASIDKEVDIRKRILRDYNMKREDFDDLQAYNDYLEMVEDLIFNLCNNIDILETNKRIAEYKEKNKDFITKNRHRQSQESLELLDMMSEEARSALLRQRDLQSEERALKAKKVEDKEKLIDDLMFLDTDAKAIVNQHAAQTEEEVVLPKRTKFSTGIDVHATNVGPFIPVAEAKPFVYNHVDLETRGPKPPTMSEIMERKYYKFVRAAGSNERPGGYHERIACARALQEAFSGLFYAPTQSAL